MTCIASQPKDDIWGTSGRVCTSLVVYSNFARQLLVTLQIYFRSYVISFQWLNMFNLNVANLIFLVIGSLTFLYPTLHPKTPPNHAE